MDLSQSFLERAAPQCARLPSASNSDRVYNCKYKTRRIHRGSRSLLALLRRNLPKRCRSLPGSIPGEAGIQEPENSSFDNSQHTCNSLISKKDEEFSVSQKRKTKKEEITIMMVNIQSVRSHQAELEFHLQMRSPQIVFLQEIG